jgi:hypothetical protein
MTNAAPQIETVYGSVSGHTADQVLDFWSTRGALAEEEAQRRLPEVVCLLRSGSEIVGVSSVHPAEVALVGGRRFWIYRNLLDESVAEHWYEMIRATFNALHEHFDAAPGSPIGLCVLLADARQRRDKPEAEWSDPRMIYAGYLRDGRQVRIAYFENATITRHELYA